MEIIGSEIYFGKDESVIIVPTLIAPAGFGMASNKYLILQKGYSKNQLGEGIIEALTVSEANELEDSRSKFWTDVTGIKSFSIFSKRYKLISISYLKETDGYKISAQKRYKDGSYGIDADDVALRVKRYSGRPLIETIADQVLAALKID